MQKSNEEIRRWHFYSITMAMIRGKFSETKQKWHVILLEITYIIVKQNWNVRNLFKSQVRTICKTERKWREKSTRRIKAYRPWISKISHYMLSHKEYQDSCKDSEEQKFSESIGQRLLDQMSYSATLHPEQLWKLFLSRLSVENSSIFSGILTS